MECEICGREIYGKVNKSIVDGAKLIVCSDCTQFASASWKTDSKKTSQTLKTTNPIPQPFVPFKQPQRIAVESLELVKDYNKRIRRGREKINLTHEELSRKIGEKISLLQKLETGKMVPDQALAKKLESSLKIKLLVSPPKIGEIDKTFIKDPQDLTLGDIVVFQRKKTDESDVEEEQRRQ